MVGPPPCTYPFWRFLVAENCPLRFGCFISFAKPKQHTAIKDDSPKPKKQKKQKKQNQKKQSQKNKKIKIQKKHYFRTLPFVYISKAILEE